MGPRMLAAIRSLYSSGTLSMKVAGTAGEPGNQQMGVRQGCPLSPTLFGLFFDGSKAAHTGRDQQSFLGKPSSHNINGDHDSQVQGWPAVEHENSISAAKAILSGSQDSSIRQMSTLWASRFRGPHSWWVKCASLQSNVHFSATIRHCVWS